MNIAQKWNFIADKECFTPKPLKRKLEYFIVFDAEEEAQEMVNLLEILKCIFIDSHRESKEAAKSVEKNSENSPHGA